MIKKLLSLTLVILPLLILAQLQSFTVNLTGTPEICTNNGTLSWTTSGTTANSTISYSIYNVTNLTTPVTSTTSLTYVGLPTGTYRVVATQTLGTSSNQATSNNFTIADQKTPMTAVTSTLASNEICGNDGSFTVNVTGGRAPYRYQLLDTNNVMISEFQSSTNSYTFTGLKAANHKYRVIDACGTGLVGERSILNTPSDFNRALFYAVYNSDCSGIVVYLTGLINTTGNSAVVKYPLNIKMEYINPNTGAIETTSRTYTSFYDDGISNGSNLFIPYFSQLSSLKIKITLTDACGRVSTQTDDFSYSNVYMPQFRDAGTVDSCPSQYFSISSSSLSNIRLYESFRVNFISAPAGFDPITYNANHGQLARQHLYGSSTQPLPMGDYTIEIIDRCGKVEQRTFTIKGQEIHYYILNSQNCDASGFHMEASLYYPESGLDFYNVQILEAPQAFIDQYGSLPYTVPDDKFLIKNGKRIKLAINNLPFGQYKIISGTSCNTSTSAITFQYNALPSRAEPIVELNCGGQFRTTNLPYVYQRYFPESDAWGTSLNNTTLDGSGEKPITFTANIGVWQTQPSGKYRIIDYPKKQQIIFENGVETVVWCAPIVLKEFEIGTALTFSNAYAFECANGTYDVALSANGGTAPLTYAIVSSEANDATTIKDNGTNPIFEGLAGGTYFFRVYDQCGNFQTRKLDIAKLGRPGIRMVPVCASNELSLVVDGLDYLKYEWTKDGEPNNILSTTNVLNLGTYTADKAGLYHVRISINSATSCINSTLDLKLTEDALTAAKAGTGQTVNLTYDENMGTNLNLFDYLQGNYDGFGTWTETTTPSSSLLIGNQWRVSSAQSGTYSFKYTVTGACGGATDTATVIINLAKVCYKKPVISAAGDALPTKVGITSLSRAGADAQGENWPMVRQGGWIALESNTKGFVVNRVPFDASGLPIGIPVANFVAGMMVYDTTNNCLKVYNGSIWSCFSTQTCPE
ncbi:SprB repeat-containing protein [Riemerella anatipestifer]|nr:SprB repeat-containing protein [Riemerella anatipestifer]